MLQFQTYRYTFWIIRNHFLPWGNFRFIIWSVWFETLNCLDTSCPAISLFSSNITTFVSMLCNFKSNVTKLNIFNKITFLVINTFSFHSYKVLIKLHNLQSLWVFTIRFGGLQTSLRWSFPTVERKSVNNGCIVQKECSSSWLVTQPLTYAIGQAQHQHRCCLLCKKWL